MLSVHEHDEELPQAVLMDGRATSDNAVAISLLASRLTSLARSAAFASFPISQRCTGATAHFSFSKALSTLLRLATSIVQAEETRNVKRLEIAKRQSGDFSE